MSENNDNKNTEVRVSNGTDQNDSSSYIDGENFTGAPQSEINKNTQTSTSSNLEKIHSLTTLSVCRICLQTDLDESNKCISPCFCRGSMSKVHKMCLETWLAQSDSDDCEICKFKYKTKRITK